MSEAASAAPEPEDDEQGRMEEAILGHMITEKPTVSWDGVVGYQKVVEMLKESVALPVKFPQLFTGARMAPNVIWVYGPIGSGKTYITMALVGSLFEEVTAFSVCSFTVKQARSERFVRSVFKLARERKPAIILIDEIDRFFGADGEDQGTSCVAEEFLQELGKYQENKGLFVIGHSCKPWALPAGIRRRADRVGYLSLPDTPTRTALLKHHLDTQHTSTEDDFLELASKSEGYTPADIVCLTKDAMMEPVREISKATHFKRVSGPSPDDPSITVDDLMAPCSADDPEAKAFSWTEHPDKVCCRPVNLADVCRCLQNSSPTVNEEETIQYEKFRKEFEIS